MVINFCSFTSCVLASHAFGHSNTVKGSSNLVCIFKRQNSQHYHSMLIVPVIFIVAISNIYGFNFPGGEFEPTYVRDLILGPNLVSKV